MAEFLRTNGISTSLEKIIEDEKGGQLLLISPYLQFSDPIKDELKRQDSRKRDIRVVFRENRLPPHESEWLAATNIRTSVWERLHAKCYMNNRYALITSMNLYAYSQQNNDEMGILVSAEDDTDLYKAIEKEAQRILDLSTEIEIRVTRVEDSDNDISRDKKDAPVRSNLQRKPASDRRPIALPELGFCLRCGIEIPCAPERPYCDSHYRSWARFKNESYEEKHCHICGTEHDTSMAKPLCLSCFRKYRSALGAAG